MSNQQFHKIFISCVFFSTARCEEVVHGEQQVCSGTVGGNITIQCSLSAHALNRKFLCRDTCHTILFETISERVGSNKYEITYGNNGLFNVTITQLTWSDSGRYSCGVGRQFQTNQCQVFEITVTGGEFLMEVMKMSLRVSGGLKKVFTLKNLVDIDKNKIKSATWPPVESKPIWASVTDIFSS